MRAGVVYRVELKACHYSAGNVFIRSPACPQLKNEDWSTNRARCLVLIVPRQYFSVKRVIDAENRTTS